MKTITLSETAYERLLSWKGSSKESFSTVVLRMVPLRGTLADLGKEINKLGPLSDEQAKQIKSAVDWANDWRNHRNPWTT